MTSAGIDSSDTDFAAVDSVLAADLPRDQPSPVDRAREPGANKSSAVLNAEIDATRAHLDDVVEELEARVDAKVEGAQATFEGAKSWVDPRRLFKEHPIAAAAIAVAAIGVGVVGYRFVRYSLPFRLFLAVRFGRLREVLPA